MIVCLYYTKSPMTLSILFFKKVRKKIIYFVSFLVLRPRCGAFGATFAQNQKLQKCRIREVLVARRIKSAQAVKIEQISPCVPPKLRKGRESAIFLRETVSRTFLRQKTLCLGFFLQRASGSDALVQKVSAALLFRQSS